MKKVYKIEDMDCTSCAMIIESDLEDAGIKGKVSYAKATLTIENDGKINSDAIKEVVEKAGYKIAS